MENNNIVNYVNIFACVRFSQTLKIHLIAHYSNATSLCKGVPALRSHERNTVKCFRVETSCSRRVLRLKFIVTVELLYDQE